MCVYLCIYLCVFCECEVRMSAYAYVCVCMSARARASLYVLVCVVLESVHVRAYMYACFKINDLFIYLFTSMYTFT